MAWTVIIGCLLWGCSGWLPTQEIFPSLTPTLTSTVTPTIVWFPATPTATPFPTQVIQPTPDQRPGIGEITLWDDFSDQTSWSTLRSEAGSVAYGLGELTLAVSQRKGMLFSLSRSQPPGDFYLEITASPSLCRGADEYGLLLRAASQLDCYRFLVSCDGKIRLDRLVNGMVVRLQDWIPSGQVPPGSPLVLRLGVWAARGELRFFINDIYQFAARDPVFTSGTLGVFARASSDSPLTVSFSELVVRGLDLARVPAPSPTPTATPRPTAKN